MHPYFPFLMHSCFPKIKHICFLVTLKITLSELFEESDNEIENKK